MRKILLMLGGGLSLAAAAIGLALPVWPTTPFVLLAAGCFSAYPPVYNKIAKIRFFREYLAHYQTGAPVSRRTKIRAIAWLWIALIASMALARREFLYILLPLVGATVTVHLIWVGREKPAPRHVQRRE
jgi:uncharacterized membrane protein YbaN (DUF454 family)